MSNMIKKENIKVINSLKEKDLTVLGIKTNFCRLIYFIPFRKLMIKRIYRKALIKFDCLRPDTWYRVRDEFRIFSFPADKPSVS